MKLLEGLDQLGHRPRLGAAAILPTSLAVVIQLYTKPRECAHAIGVWAAIGSAALVLGPVLGGALVGPFGWRAIFALNVPLIVLSLLAGLKFLPQVKTARAGRADLAGQLLGTVALAALVFALIDGSHSGFAQPAVVAAGGLAGIALLAFVKVELRQARPLVDLRWFRRPEFSGANAAAGLMNLGTLGDAVRAQPVPPGNSRSFTARDGPQPAATGVVYLALATQEAGIEKPLG
jgi:DHA2 family methylenomycin A resistance protein-like MFS transporter